MAYVHRHACGWSQDDFYDENYNPAKYLMTWNNYLYGKNSDEIDKQFSRDSEFLRENGPITTREVLAREYESFARRIRSMKWLTWESFKADPDKRCPQCGGSDELDID